MFSAVKSSCACAAGKNANRQPASNDGAKKRIRGNVKDKSDGFNKAVSNSVINKADKNTDNITNSNTKNPYNKPVKKHDSALISSES
jgi:hypothetical protein